MAGFPLQQFQTDSSRNQIQTVAISVEGAQAAAARANVGAMYNDDGGPDDDGTLHDDGICRTSSTRSRPPCASRRGTSRGRPRHAARALSLLAGARAAQAGARALLDARRLLHHVLVLAVPHAAQVRVRAGAAAARLGASGIARGAQRRVPPRQVLNVAVSDTMACVSYTFGSPGDRSALCAVQASMQQLFETASVCWTTVIAGARSKHLSPSSLGARGMTLRRPALSLSLSSSGALYLAIIHGRDATAPISLLRGACRRTAGSVRDCDRRGSMYGTAGRWCWTTPRWVLLLPGDGAPANLLRPRAAETPLHALRALAAGQRAGVALRWLLFYGPLWLAISFSTAVYLLTVRADLLPPAAAPRDEAGALARALLPPPHLRALRSARVRIPIARRAHARREEKRLRRTSTACVLCRAHPRAGPRLGLEDAELAPASPSRAPGTTVILVLGWTADHSRVINTTTGAERTGCLAAHVYGARVRRAAFSRRRGRG